MYVDEIILYYDSRSKKHQITLNSVALTSGIAISPTVIAIHITFLLLTLVLLCFTRMVAVLVSNRRKNFPVGVEQLE